MMTRSLTASQPLDMQQAQMPAMLAPPSLPPELVMLVAEQVDGTQHDGLATLLNLRHVSAAARKGAAMNLTRVISNPANAQRM